MLCGMLWTYWVLGALIDCLTAVGVVTKLSATFLALSVIAIGNALPDAIVTVSLAKKGKAQMGITGSYAGQMFGLLVGFGAGMLKKSLGSGESIPFDLFTNWQANLLNIFLVFTALVTLLTTFFYLTRNELKFDKRFGYILLIIYILFQLLATGIEIKADYFTTVFETHGEKPTWGDPNFVNE